MNERKERLKRSIYGVRVFRFAYVCYVSMKRNVSLRINDWQQNRSEVVESEYLLGYGLDDWSSIPSSGRDSYIQLRVQTSLELTHFPIR
jgi:hypothetical protein